MDIQRLAGLLTRLGTIPALRAEIIAERRSVY